jgi:protein prenyltransferase alpha subunit repeat containing protein 1
LLASKDVFPYAFGSSDELGFIHPSQFSLLNEESGISANLSDESILQSADRIASSDEYSNQEKLCFWNKDHKLGISTHVLLPLYKAAKHAFFTAFKQHKMCGNQSDKVGTSLPPLASHDNLESTLLRHSRSLLLLSCDFTTAWNCRLSSYLLIFLYDVIDIFKSTP